jgi:hypothetical protein
LVTALRSLSGNPWTGVFHADDGLVPLAKHNEHHSTIFRRKLYCVVDQIDDGLEQKIAVAVNDRVICGFDSKSDRSLHIVLAVVNTDVNSARSPILAEKIGQRL